MVVRSKKQLAALEEAGVRTFGDLASSAATTASYSGSGMSSLPEQIDLARAALGPATDLPAARTSSAIAVPRADIEVDIDMENIEEGVYLWGALVTERTERRRVVEYTRVRDMGAADSRRRGRRTRFGSGPGSPAFATRPQRAGRSFRAYCYNASAENTYLRRLGVAGGILDEVTAFIRSDEWVDLLKVVDDQLITGGGLGLKKVAPLAGFTGTLTTPAAALSMLRYDARCQRQRRRERERSSELAARPTTAATSKRRWPSGSGSSTGGARSRRSSPWTRLRADGSTRALGGCDVDDAH